MDGSSSYESRLAVMETHIAMIREDVDEMNQNLKEGFGRIRALEVSWGKLIGAAATLGVVSGGSAAIMVEVLRGL